VGCHRGVAMNSVEITIKVPEELIARAQAAGVEIESQTQEFIMVLENEIRRREAGQQLPDEAILTTRPEPVDANGWPIGYFDETYGSLADIPIERPDQPPLETRDPIS
jgi:post-segregation antitoxin (ccd killing protein)